LKEIWRWDKWNIIEALNCIKNIWFNNISLDFIIWLPHVKKWEIKKDIEYILSEYDFIKHISVYMLEEHYYPWNWEEISISENDYLWEYIEVKNFLESKWFNRYEVSNFAKLGYECKHNMAYWNHSEIKAIWLWSSWLSKLSPLPPLLSRGEGDNIYIRYSFSDKFSNIYINYLVQQK